MMLLYYKRIPIWINRRRVIALIEFRRLVVEYYNNVTYSEFELGVAENARAKELRSKINLQLFDVKMIINNSGISDLRQWYPPPVLGGPVLDIELITNLFQLPRFEIGVEQVTDMLEVSIGKYESDRKLSIIRAFNPLYYVGMVFWSIVNAPFFLLGQVGFNLRRIEDNPMTKIIKFALYTIGVLASIITILVATDNWTKIKDMIGM